jgi:large subunit ribosomal protein L2
MPVRQYNPTSAGRRFQSVLDFSEVSDKKPERQLLQPSDTGAVMSTAA